MKWKNCALQWTRNEGTFHFFFSSQTDFVCCTNMGLMWPRSHGVKNAHDSVELTPPPNSPLHALSLHHASCAVRVLFGFLHATRLVYFLILFARTAAPTNVPAPKQTTGLHRRPRNGRLFTETRKPEQKDGVFHLLNKWCNCRVSGGNSIHQTNSYP